MPEITIDRKLTWGGLLTIATILVTTGITWGVFQAQASQQSADVSEVQQSVKVLQAARYDDNARMVRVETLLDRILNEVTKPN